jgi:hypothetical protein
MMDKACIGVCNNRARRLWDAYDKAWKTWDASDPETRGEPPTQPDVHIGYGNPWCTRCTAMIRRCLADLDELAALRAMMADGYQAPSGQQGDRVKSSREEPSPSPAQDDLDEMVRWLRGQEHAYRVSQDWPAAPYRGVNAPALTSTLSWLGSHLDAILRVEAMSEEFGKGVLARHRAMQAKTSTKPPLTHKPLPCPRCGRRSLFRHDDETVRCRGSETVDCGKIMTAKEYSEYEDEADQQVAS